MKAKKFSFHAGLLCIAALFVTLLLLLSSCGEDDKKPTETVDDKNFTYAVENGQATVASYTPSGEISPTLNIPSTLGGYPVVRIGEGAFSGLKNIKEIVLPDSVTDIGKEAFKDCSDLTNITIPNSVTNIGGSAFSGCAGLTSITIPDSVTSIGSYAFYGCTSLTSITIPDSVTDIRFRAFSGCIGLTSITIGNSVTVIENVAFEGCTNLTNIYITDIAAWCKISGLRNLTNHEGSKNLYLYLNNELITNLVIPDDVTSIGDYAFYRCTGLTSITIPNSVTSIGDDAFSGCAGLKNIYITDMAAWCKISGLFALMGCNADNKNLYLNNELITNLVIPNGVTSIGNYAFCKCTSLTSITIPNSVTNIGDSAFYRCTGLTSITIPDSVTNIGYGAFYDCGYLTSITLPFVGTSKDGRENTHFGYIFGAGIYWENAKYVPSNLKTVTFTGGTNIDEYAFSGCAGLTSITIPDSVTSIGFSAFEGCTGLTSITIPFVGASKDGRENTHFGYIFGADSYSKNDRYVPYSLKTVIITGGTSIGSSAFWECKGLTSITIPDSVTSIGSGAFYDCWYLTSITIPDSVTNIGESAFSGCTILTSITIPDSVTSIGESAFSGCTNLQFNAYDNALYLGNAENPYLVLVKAKNQSITSCVIFEKTKVIYDSAFYGRTELTSVTIPDSVTSIGKYAFRHCAGLTSITIGNGATSIGSSAFEGCTGLKSITLPFIGATKGGTENTHFGYIFGAGRYSENAKYVPSNLKTVTITGGTNIDEYAFSGCSGLTSITIPDSVTSIEDSAFSGCTGLKSITIPDSVTNIGSSAFYRCTGLTSITIPGSVTNIGSSAFSDCTSLKSITIPDGVTSIGESAFSGCTNLQFNAYDNALYLGNAENPYLVLVKAKNKSITSCMISEKAKFICNSAFSDCTSLTSVTIGNGVTSIGSFAFSGCTSLKSITVDSKNKVYHASNNCLIETATKTLIAGCKTSVIPTDGSVTSIGSYAFSACTGLTSIAIPNSVTDIGYQAFKGCTGLTSITIPDSVTSIGDWAFYGCAGLTSIAIPDSVISIGSEAFYGCGSLKFIYYTGTAAQWAKISKGYYAIPDDITIVYNYKPTV